MKKFLIITAAGLAVFAAGILFVEFSGLFEASHISPFGWFAFLAAGFLTVIMSTGLFALIFFSARSGRDDFSDF